MRKCEILIVTALLPEAQAVANAFHLPHVFPLTYTPSVSVALIAPRAALLTEVTVGLAPRRIILAGLAGALDQKLRIGDVIISTNDGLIHTSETVVSTPAEKMALFRSTKARAVDMETAHVRAFAKARNIPCTVIRAISDTAWEPVDPAVLSLVDPKGHPRTSRALALLACHPTKLKTLLRLNRASKVALSKLSAAVLAHVRAERTKASTAS